ncbi:MAG TPA: bifunctional folylpolyglutamate synthase/dihydrofolate synthase [Desulfuromonadales bacterium]|nr:bifunctional folylpolyglutamate synthase/dihydrofolate synthase [Desulfuromonadales bacterium]
MPLAPVLDKLYARRRFGVKPGVDRVKLILGRLGNPEKGFSTIHVVGTNGKGSTAAFLSSLLIRSGLRTALFSSPHLLHFTERFRIDGNDCPADSVAASLDDVLAVAPDEATFFEITTALAALLFAREGCEYAVMEAGMGGWSDATAAFSGIMTIITPISLDHQEYLGATLTEIACEKAGIVEPGTPVISAHQHDDVLGQIERQCNRGGNALKLCDRDFSARWSGSGELEYRGINFNLQHLKPGIPGRYQSENAALALAAAELLGAVHQGINAATCAEGIRDASWPGRMELVSMVPPLLLDGAHNAAGAAALAEALQVEYAGRRILLVTGVCADKDFGTLYAPLLPLVSDIFTVTPAVDRALDGRELAAFFDRSGWQSRFCGSLDGGISAARRASLPEDLILVCGSLFLVGEARALLADEPFEGVRG